MSTGIRRASCGESVEAFPNCLETASRGEGFELLGVPELEPQRVGDACVGCLLWSPVSSQPEAGRQPAPEPWRQTLLLVDPLGRAEPGAEPADRAG